MLFVDSNIWCYYFDAAAKEHAKVAQFIGRTIGKEEMVLNTVVAMEIAQYLIKNLGPVRGREKMDALLGFPFTITDFDYDLLLRSVQELATHAHAGIGGRDATILASMRALGVRRIATHDRAFQRVDGIEVVDPCA
ncbi:MAG: type II toxin-antitoxin system VapC family toxin [Candidatus Aenigmarchaeota archaeon]|nr:type II toxin-antitoxin system VapC family toxin [Candidatus Aenigmarchaeota archaeon]